MAAFSSNIDITSDGTYGMDITNGESSAQVASDLNGKMQNIQNYLQNGLPEVWTGSSLPDSLPNGKLIQYNNNVYQSNLQRLLTQIDYNNIINTEIPEIVNNSIIYGTSSGTNNKTKNVHVNTEYRCGVVMTRSLSAYYNDIRYAGTGCAIIAPGINLNNQSATVANGAAQRVLSVNISNITNTSFDVYISTSDSLSFNFNIDYILFV